VWYYKQGRVIAVDAMNAAAHYMVGKRLIEGGQSVAPEKVRDMAQDMKSWLAK
jgi:3-phenylpropionate/trans-cinnamate dioxygenase ferredoxin reductase subunit